MKIAIASDHAGYLLKDEIIKHLREKGYQYTDFGVNSEKSVDYPDYAEKVALSVKNKEHDFGILVCGSGIGMSITANKIPGIRAALCSETYSARMAREHNDANILALGGRVIGPELAKDVVDTFLSTRFCTSGRHHIRVSKMNEIEKKYRNGPETSSH